MDLKEFRAIEKFLPEGTQIAIMTSNRDGTHKKSTLTRESWGNHDGRYNMKCLECGWESVDIYPQRKDTEPSHCPQCG